MKARLPLEDIKIHNKRMMGKKYGRIFFAFLRKLLQIKFLTEMPIVDVIVVCHLFLAFNATGPYFQICLVTAAILPVYFIPGVPKCLFIARVAQ